MVISAKKIEKECSYTDDIILSEDVKWLERLIDKNIEHYKYFLNQNRQIKISRLEGLSHRELKVHDIDGKIPSRKFLGMSFWEALHILQKKYKKQGWLIKEVYEKILLKKIKSKSFLKSLFSKNRKEYSSVLTEMEKKYL